MIEKPRDSFRFAILCDGPQLQLWQQMTVESLLADGHSIAIVVVNAEKNQSETFWRKLKHYPYRNLLFRAWYRYFLKPGSKKMKDAGHLFKSTVIFYETTVRKGKARYFSEACIEAVKISRADFILRFGFGIIRGELLHTTPLGVWSFHHDDPAVVRGVPSNFWEIYEKYNINGAILQRIDESIDAGEIIWAGCFPTIHHSWKANIDQAYFGSTGWPALVCRYILANGGKFPGQAEKQKPAPMRYAPDNPTMLRFLWIMAINRIKYHLKDLFIAEKWAIGHAMASFDELCSNKTDPASWHWLEGPIRRQYHADVSGFILNGELKLVSEFFDYRNRTGKIFLTDAGTKTGSSVIEKEHHLAFPYVFECDDVVYCIPETSESGQIELYRYDREAAAFIIDHILIEGLRAVDPVLFRHNDLWWLMFTEKDRSNYALHAWYSSEMKGRFVPHLLNPVKIDPRSSRPAGGIIRHNGKWLRPAQDCSKYSGHRIAINEITALSPAQFEERTLFYIGPGQNRQYPHGIHTLNIAGPYLMVDAKRHTFIFFNLIHKIWGKLRKLAAV